MISIWISFPILRRAIWRSSVFRLAIAEGFCERSQRGNRPPAKSQTAELSDAPPITAETQTAERRQVTVLFSDLVGSTALANEIDPEEMSMLIRRYQDACAGAIVRFDGFIAKFMGDGVLAYFGYPQAQEDAAERSVYAALAIIESLAELKGPDGQALGTRIGIATGIVVIGDIIGSGVGARAFHRRRDAESRGPAPERGRTQLDRR